MDDLEIGEIVLSAGFFEQDSKELFFGKSPERLLHAAVLESAVHDLRRGIEPYAPGRVLIHARLARDWVMEESETDAPIDFKECCDVLDVDHIALRELLAKQGLLKDYPGVVFDARQARLAMFLGYIPDTTLIRAKCFI